MSNKLIVIGMQWGDEGKGRIVDLLSQQADRVVRFNGGHNAGHTLVVQGQTWKLALLPCGLLHGKPGVIGSGLVIDPEALLAELDRVAQQGLAIGPGQLLVDETATLVLPSHAALDQAEETQRRHPIGTTGRGIGPAFADRAGRRAIRIGDLADPGLLAQKVEEALHYHNSLLEAWGHPPHDPAATVSRLLAQAPRLLPYVGSAWQQLQQADQAGERLLFEGAQALMLDNSHGSYPFVTASSTLPAQAVLGSGLGAAAQASVLGVCKAYTTRVGAGPFPSELSGELADLLRQRGHEYGTNTGRPRRCGWLDIALLRQGLQLAQVHSLALTKLDVLDTLPTLQLCVGYRIRGVFQACFPASSAEQAACEPVYETLPGWQQSTVGIRQFEALPAAAQAYVQRIAALLDCPVSLVSTSPEREDIITLQQPW